MTWRLILLLLVPAAQDPDREIRRELAARAAALEREFLPGVKSAEDFERLRPALRDAYFDMLGLRPLPERTPLEPRITGRVDAEGYTIEKLHFQSRPGLYVTGNLYLPRPASGRHPAILYLCGHSNRGRDGNKAAYQDHGIWFALHGYVCLTLDTLQLGEVAGIHHGTYREGRWWWHSAGYTPAGVECWNGIRGLDYLVSRPEVDPTRIGVTGISGGGAATFWISAADERVRAAAPVSGMADLVYYVGEDGVNGHCDCMFLYNTARWNWTTIAALISPRPLLFANSDQDPIFPMSANERVINRLETLYARFGAGDRVEAVVSIGGHAYRRDLRRAIFEFFNRHLKQDARPVEDPDAGFGPDGKHRHAGRELRVFPEDSDLPRDSLNARADEIFPVLSRPEAPAPGGFEPWRARLVSEIRKRVFAGLPEDPAPGRIPGAPGVGPSVADLPGAASAPPWMVVLNPDEPAGELPSWARPLVGGAAARVVAPRRGWTRKNPPNTVERSYVLLGTTVDAERVWDVRAALRADGRSWRLAGRGPAGILAAYAALLEPERAAAVTLVEPPASHREGPHFLGVLRALDIPDALGALAPRPLTLAGARDPAFDRTLEIYRAAGAEDRIERR
ncbi:MAG TPA: prolyl oligopeptidase family serine peptidase [Planctomycetota bacterium]|nr:prolyl oligopeptidase family serine peptidase [Planctomycetota bacterium]